MFLHLGGNEVVRTKDVVAILNAEYGPLAGEFKGQKQLDAEIKAIIVTAQGNFFSPISSGTLKKRAEYPAGQGE